MKFIQIGRAFINFNKDVLNSSVGVMYRSCGPNTGSNPGGGQILKKFEVLPELTFGNSGSCIDYNLRHKNDNLFLILKKFQKFLL